MADELEPPPHEEVVEILDRIDEAIEEAKTARAAEEQEDA